MMKPVRCIEKATGIEVLLSTPQQWEPYPVQANITYANGMTYSMPDADVLLYFEVVTPQEVFIVASGGGPLDRPLKEQDDARIAKEGALTHGNGELPAEHPLG